MQDSEWRAMDFVATAVHLFKDDSEHLVYRCAEKQPEPELWRSSQ
jgi:hypothetical protein